MDALYGIIGSTFSLLSPAYGSTHFALTAYPLEPTHSADSLARFRSVSAQRGNSQFGNRLKGRSLPTPLPIALPQYPNSILALRLS